MLEQKRRLRKDELAAEYPDSQWRNRLLELSSYVDILQECILRPDYKVPDDLNSSILLSDAGKEVQQALTTKYEVNAKDARVLCLLEFAHVDLLVDVENLDLPGLRASVARQLLAGDIRFPFVFGRELYDRAADLFEYETPSLGFDDTTRLLEGTSAGVFQLGSLVTGPYGLVESRETRWLKPLTWIPLYTCAELSCDVVHRCLISSDPGAPINRARPKIVQVLDKISEQPSAWGEFLNEIAGLDSRRYDDRSCAALPYLLGDAMSDRELQQLVTELMDGTSGRLRSSLSLLKIDGNARESTRGMSRAQLMQLALLCTDSEILSALNRLVLAGDINVPVAEVRRAVVNGQYSTGMHGLKAEMGSRGVRFVSRSVGLAQLRLRRLADKLYDLEDAGDVAELEFQLRDVDAATVQSRLEGFIASASPEEVVRRLVLARNTNVITASEELAVETDRISDADMIDSILWKLGFDIDRESDVNDSFWEFHDQMKDLTQTAGISAIVDQEVVRGLASSYFVALENVLEDSLAYCTWSLTSDHVASTRAYTYRVDADRSEALMRLNEAEERRDSGPESIRFGDKNELYPLCRGYGILATWLREIQADQGQYVRLDKDLPPLIRYSDLRKYPFSNTVAFLNLLPASQDHVVNILEDLSRRLVSAKVSDVRNDWLHYRKSTADVSRLAACLSAVGDVVEALEREGLCRVRYRYTRDFGDRWGRRIYVLADSRGREIAIARPVQSDTSQLPTLRSSQYLMPGVRFAEPSEMLRFRSSVSSEYSEMWDNFPRRRRIATLQTDEVGGGRSGLSGPA